MVSTGPAPSQAARCPTCAQPGVQFEASFEGGRQDVTGYLDPDGRRHLHVTSATIHRIRCPQGHIYMIREKSPQCWCGWTTEPTTDADEDSHMRDQITAQIERHQKELQKVLGVVQNTDRQIAALQAQRAEHIGLVERLKGASQALAEVLLTIPTDEPAAPPVEAKPEAN